MARRTNLGSVSSGLIGSFNSRNNDVGGYWGIGKLFSFANSGNVDTVSIDLLSGAISPPTDQFASLIAFYRAMLEARLKGQGISAAWVSKAVITVKFNQAFDHKYHYFRSALGTPYVCKCEIIDDNGKMHCAAAGNNCRPHSPAEESRSSRGQNF
ncbi:hypothetical protein [Undibacterium sp. Ren11W]|uniref:hypothetical protein n=1 Tax=Undibacterium sp. Ren11W TaxID=3413045 RepID=UPI003BF2A3D0